MDAPGAFCTCLSLMMLAPAETCLEGTLGAGVVSEHPMLVHYAASPAKPTNVPVTVS